jgi:hypothetical protein
MFPAPIRVLVNFAHSGLSHQSRDNEGKPLIYPCHVRPYSCPFSENAQLTALEIWSTLPIAS